MTFEEYEEICEEFGVLLGLMEDCGCMGEAFAAVEMAQDVFMGEEIEPDEQNPPDWVDTK